MSIKEMSEIACNGTKNNIVRAFVQARMNSSRFPGKVLAPFMGRPVIAHVISRLERVLPRNLITIATSTTESDDPLALYVQEMGVSIYRGPLKDVFGRFRQCLEQYPCDWFFRICADSPMLNVGLLKKVLQHAVMGVDLVTNVQVRTFPKGYSVELLNATTFYSINQEHLSAEEREHLTMVYYINSDRYSIVNLESSNPVLANMNFTIDTVADLHRLEEIVQQNYSYEYEDLATCEYLSEIEGKTIMKEFK